MKLLNLDSLAKKTRTVQLGGKSYEVKEMSVDDFIQTTEQATKLAQEKDPVVQLNATLDMILQAVPGMPRAELGKLSLEKLLVISRFIQGDMDDEPDEEAAGPNV